MYRAYTLKSISGLVWPSMAATQEGASPAARAFEAKVCLALPLGVAHFRGTYQACDTEHSVLHAGAYS
jgi:hypothetical protein